MLVKENKVEVIFLSAYDKRVFLDGDPRKKKIFSETFGKFPNCSLNLVGFDSEGKGVSKSEWVKKNVPDCDVVIDDNPNILTNVLKNNDKMIVISPYYPTIKHHKKVLLVKISISNLNKNDFKNKRFKDFGFGNYFFGILFLLLFSFCLNFFKVF